MMRVREPSPLPGFGLAFGLTMTMLGIVVIVPIGALLLRGADIGLGELWRVVATERVWKALRLSFGLSLAQERRSFRNVKHYRRRKRWLG